MSGRAVAVAVAAALLAAGAAGAAPGSTTPRSYTFAATRACLLARPGSLEGLPPSSPPLPPALFVYAFRPGDFPMWDLGMTRRPRQLGAWYGGRGYEGAILSFFASTEAARRAEGALTATSGGTVARNVVVSWGERPAPRRRVRELVLGCLRSGPAAPPLRARPRRASFATFAGAWGGHTRSLSVSAAGRGRERVDDGCCRRTYDLTFQLVTVQGTLTHATARYRVLAFRRYESGVKALRAGELGTLTLTNGIVRNGLTGVIYCSDQAWGATGACGA